MTATSLGLPQPLSWAGQRPLKMASRTKSYDAPSESAPMSEEDLLTMKGRSKLKSTQHEPIKMPFITVQKINNEEQVDIWNKKNVLSLGKLSISNSSSMC
jgi:hypothetical protein